MAHKAADGSMWTNASQAKKVPVPGKAQGDGKQPVSSFPKPAPARAATADPVPSTPSDSSAPQGGGPEVQVTQDGDMFTVTAKFASADEAHAAAHMIETSAGDDMSDQAPQAMGGNPAASMM